jgi:hypothetical protein
LPISLFAARLDLDARPRSAHTGGNGRPARKQDAALRERGAREGPLSLHRSAAIASSPAAAP